MKHKKNMNAVIGGVIGVLVIGGLIVIGMNKAKKVIPEPIVVEEVPTSQVMAPKKKSAIDSNTPKATLAVVPAMSYMDALKNYKGSIVQFNQSCGSVPAKQSFKKGTFIMLDNRSDQTRKITLGSISVSLLPYSYTTMALNTVGLFGVNCDSAVNVATIIVQE